MKKENLEECFQMALKWRKENGCNDDTDKNAEMCVTMNALRLFEELDLKGGILRIDGKIVAFTIGESNLPGYICCSHRESLCRCARSIYYDQSAICRT